MAYGYGSDRKYNIDTIPEYTTSVLNRAILRCCSTGYIDRVRRYKHHVNTFETDTQRSTSDSIDEVWEENWDANPFPRVSTASNIDYKKVQPNFCWLPIGIIKRTFEKTTQWAKMPGTTHLFK